jgi:hypothetical protein
VKKVFDELSNEIKLIMCVAIAMLAILFYSNSKSYEKSLTNVCSTYQSLIDTLRNETLKEEIERLQTPYHIPNNSTIEGRFELKMMPIESVIRKECRDVYEVNATFPTYDQFVNGYMKN